MNKKVFISMLVLTISFLVSLYVLKIFFPQEFMMGIQNKNLIKIGAFIDEHKWLGHICTLVPAFITYWLFMYACKGGLYLNWKEIIVILISIIVIRAIGYYDYNLRTHISICSFFVIPLIFKHDLGKATIVYGIHGLAQVLSLTIRSLPMYLININFMTSFMMTIECYLWLILFYIIFNYKRKENRNEI